MVGELGSKRAGEREMLAREREMRRSSYFMNALCASPICLWNILCDSSDLIDGSKFEWVRVLYHRNGTFGSPHPYRFFCPSTLILFSPIGSTFFYSLPVQVSKYLLNIVRELQQRNRLFFQTCQCWPICLPKLVSFVYLARVPLNLSFAVNCSVVF